MTTYGKESGIAITTARVKNFRSLADIEVDLSDLTVLIGANNAGKTSFLDALFAAVGAGRRSLGADDVRLAPGEVTAPKSREVLIDILLRPISSDSKVADKYPEGSFWTSLWGTPGIANDDDFNELTPIRTVLKWNEMKQEYIVERKFLKEWRSFCSGLMNPDTHLGENARHGEVSDEQATSFVFPRVQGAGCLSGARQGL